MNRKITILLSGLFLAVLAVSIMAMSSPKKENALPNNAVAYVAPSGGYQIFTNRLVPHFQSGAQIDHFAIIHLADGHHLLRRGQDANGTYRTETIKLQLRPSGVLVFEPVVWYTICNSPQCMGCSPNQQNNGCDCPGGGNCTWGIDVSGMGLEVVVLPS